MRHQIFALAVLGAVAFGGGEANATTLDIAPASPTFSPCGVCTTFEGRGIYITANSDFAVDSISWRGNVTTGTYELSIWQGITSGGALGTLLTTVVQNLSGGVYQWNTIDADFSFSAGSDYYVSLARQDGAVFSTNYDFISYNQTAANLGILTLIDGRHGNAPIFGDNNSWTTHFAFQVVDSIPEPVSSALFGTALSVLALARRRSARRRG